MLHNSKQNINLAPLNFGPITGEYYNCNDFRIYMGLTDNNKITLILVGLDESGNDLTNGVILDDLGGCPPFCSINSPLMV